MRMTPLFNKCWQKCGGLISVFGFSKCHGNLTFSFHFSMSVRFSFTKTDSERTCGFPHNYTPDRLGVDVVEAS